MSDSKISVKYNDINDVKIFINGEELKDLKSLKITSELVKDDYDPRFKDVLVIKFKPLHTIRIETLDKDEKID